MKIVSVKDSAVSMRSWSEGRWSDDAIKVDGTVPTMKVENFVALMLPCGVNNSDMLRMQECGHDVRE